MNKERCRQLEERQIMELQMKEAEAVAEAKVIERVRLEEQRRRLAKEEN